MATVTSAGVGGYWPSITLEGITQGLPLSSEKKKKTWPDPSCSSSWSKIFYFSNFSLESHDLNLTLNHRFSWDLSRIYALLNLDYKARPILNKRISKLSERPQNQIEMEAPVRLVDLRWWSPHAWQGHTHFTPVCVARCIVTRQVPQPREHTELSPPAWPACELASAGSRATAFVYVCVGTVRRRLAPLYESMNH